MIVRSAALGDVDSIHTLGEQVSEFSVSKATVTFWPKNSLSSAVLSDDVLILVAEEQDIGGFIIVNYNHGFKKALIENIFVRPDLRGQNIGGQLLQKTVDTLQGMGCEYVATLVPPDANDAINLYVRSGFDHGESFVWLDRSLSDSFKRLN